MREEKKYLVVLFHGKAKSSPIFRGYDYFFENANVMSISDPLLKYYKEILDSLKQA